MGNPPSEPHPMSKPFLASYHQYEGMFRADADFEFFDEAEEREGPANASEATTSN
jgi:hypothetical protein